jgi:Ferric uptake regulator family
MASLNQTIARNPVGHRRYGQYQSKLIEAALRRAKLRPTRQRLALIELLLTMKKHAINADTVYQESIRKLRPIPRSTIGAALRQFEQNGLVKRIDIDRSRKAWFALGSGILPLELGDQKFDAPAWANKSLRQRS